ncbi:hypothetical protein ACFVVX_06645 [Kitasatospora sp. NPDC058170]|uniref:hypothetical protein n=1 Tax=Kitasatospora sp. NPDC058170 TaxID=3346364 RepID=UPI0036DCDE9F
MSDTSEWTDEAVPGPQGRQPGQRAAAWALTLCGVFMVAVAGWGVAAMTQDQSARETDVNRAERLARLHAEQHPGKGRYYVPEAASYGLAPDGTPVGYLHYRLGGGDDVNLDDFLRVYDLPQPGAPAPLPADLRAALPGEEPTEAAQLPEPPDGNSSATSTGSTTTSTGRQIYVVPADTGLAGAADVYVRATRG